MFAAGKPRSASRIWPQGVRYAGNRCGGGATPSASRQLPREGANYHKIHVVREFSAAAGKPRSASRIWPQGVRYVGNCCGLWATPSASRQLPQEGANYHKIHVVRAFSAAEGKPRSASRCSLRRPQRGSAPRSEHVRRMASYVWPQGVRYAGNRCGLWATPSALAATARGRRSHRCGGQHAADTAAKREPITTKSM